MDMLFILLSNVSCFFFYRSSLNTLTPLTTEKIQRPLQKLLFSATLTQNPEKLALLQLFKPRFFTVSKSKDIGENTMCPCKRKISIILRGGALLGRAYAWWVMAVLYPNRKLGASDFNCGNVYCMMRWFLKFSPISIHALYSSLLCQKQDYQICNSLFSTAKSCSRTRSCSNSQIQSSSTLKGAKL